MKLRSLALLSTISLEACGSLTNKEPPPKPFAGTRWDVVLEMPIPGEPPNFRFGDGRMEGFGGCNRVNAQYLQDSVGARAIAIRRIESGTRACDPAVKAVENRILTVLQSVSSYSITADVMTMSGSAGTLVLRAHDGAARAAPAAAPASSTGAASLAGTRWIGVVEPGTPDGNVPQLELVAEGRLAGYTGCNLMSGSWTMQGNEAHVGRLIATKRACAGPESGIEQRLVAAMQDGRLVREGSKLVAIGKNGERFEFNEAR